MYKRYRSNIGYLGGIQGYQSAGKTLGKPEFIWHWIWPGTWRARRMESLYAAAATSKGPRAGQPHPDSWEGDGATNPGNDSQNQESKTSHMRRLRKAGPFSLDSDWGGGVVRSQHIYKYLIEWNEEGKARLFWVVITEKTTGNGHKLKKKYLQETTFFFSSIAMAH